MKSELFDRRVRLNEALFYVRYTDLIRQVVAPITNCQRLSPARRPCSRTPRR